MSWGVPYSFVIYLFGFNSTARRKLSSQLALLSYGAIASCILLWDESMIVLKTISLCRPVTTLYIKLRWCDEEKVVIDLLSIQADEILASRSILV